MKHKINIFGALALTGILLFAACSDLMNPPQVSTGGETGKVIIQIGGGEERTLTPPATALSNLDYNLVIKNSSNAVIYDDAVEGLFEYTLATGNYTLIVDAFNEDNELVASREINNVIISPGQTTTAKIVLQPVANVDIPGKFSYSVTLPYSYNGILYTSATLTLNATSPNSGSVSINLVDSPSDTIDLPPGRYTMTINVASPRQINGQPLSIFRRETVYIYSNLTTSTEAGAYVFTVEDFEAEVRFKGTAQVRNVSWDTSEGYQNWNYIPKTVYIQSSYVDSPLREAAIVQNAQTGAYEWELALPSHYVAAQLTDAIFWFRAEHNDDSTKFLYSLPSHQSVSNSQGITGINLTMMVVPVPDLPEYITLENNLDVVLSGGQATVIITPPAKTGLIASSVYMNSSQVAPYSIDTSSGKIQFTIDVPQWQPSISFSAQFFHLNGTASAVPNADNYIAKSVEAYALEGGWNPIAIGSAAPVNETTNKWEIDVPATYVFRGLADTNIYFKVNFGLEAAGSPIVYTYDTRADTVGWDVLSLTSSTDTVDLVPVNLFQLTGVRAEIATSNSIVVYWDGASNWATGYNVYSSVDGYTAPLNPTPLPLTPTSPNSYTDTTVTITAGTSYDYCVAGIRTDETVGPRFYTSVSRITGVRAAINTFNSIVISWDDASNWTTGYNVYSSFDDYTNPLNPTPISRTATSYTDTTVTITAGTWYGYYVAGIRTDGTVGPRFYTSVSQLSQPNVSAYSYTTSYGGLLDYFQVYWTYINSAAEYYVERSTNEGSWTHLTTTTNTSYYDYDVALVDARYQYRVTARAVSGVSNPAADSTQQTIASVHAPSSQAIINWNASYRNSIASGGKTIYRLSNSSYSDAYLYLSSSYGYVTFIVFNTRTKSSQTYTSASGDSFSLDASGSYADLILVVEGSFGSGSYDFTIQNY